MGPDLTHVDPAVARREHVAQYAGGLARWLRNPQAVKPGNLMPNLNLSDQDVAAPWWRIWIA